VIKINKLRQIPSKWGFIGKAGRFKTHPLLLKKYWVCDYISHSVKQAGLNFAGSFDNSKCQKFNI